MTPVIRCAFSPNFARYWDVVSSTRLVLFLWETGTGKTVRPMLSDRCPVCLYWGQTVGWIRTPLDKEVGLGPGDTVLDGDPAPPPTERGTATPTFWPTALARSLISATAELLLEAFNVAAATPATSVVWLLHRALKTTSADVHTGVQSAMQIACVICSECPPLPRDTATPALKALLYRQVQLPQPAYELSAYIHQTAKRTWCRDTPALDEHLGSQSHRKPFILRLPLDRAALKTLISP